jgi:creatinine amidohydrolase
VCSTATRPANDAFDRYLTQHGYPLGLHGYLFDTSEMMYLDRDNTWVRRDLISSAVGDPVVGHTAGDAKAQFGPHSPQNGILGDARRSTAELGKRAFDMKVDYAVRQIRSLLPHPSGGDAALPSGNSTAATSSSPRAAGELIQR